jgi:hypothetical protein
MRRSIWFAAVHGAACPYCASDNVIVAAVDESYRAIKILCCRCLKTCYAAVPPVTLTEPSASQP